MQIVSTLLLFLNVFRISKQISPSKEEVFRVKGHKDDITDVHISPDSKHVSIAVYDLIMIPRRRKFVWYYSVEEDNDGNGWNILFKYRIVTNSI